MYLGPPALLAFFLNVGFLLLLYHIKMRQGELAKLLSEASSSAQEMSGLTHSYYKDKNGLIMNGGMYAGENGLYDQIGQSESRHTLPCPLLETIHMSQSFQTE